MKSKEELIHLIAEAEVDAIDFKDYCRKVYFDATEAMEDWSLEELIKEAHFYGLLDND